MSIDPKVYELAALFLKDASETDKEALAGDIQQIIDDHIEALAEFEASEAAVNDIPSPL